MYVVVMASLLSVDVKHCFISLDFNFVHFIISLSEWTKEKQNQQILYGTVSRVMKIKTLYWLNFLSDQFRVLTLLL
jgi:hypothetical protein